MAQPKTPKSIGDKVKKLFHRDTAEMSKEEIIEEYRSKMLVDDIPTPIYEAMEKKIHDEWKAKLNPDLLFNSQLEEGGLAKFLPWIQIAVAFITMIVVVAKK
jgi:hypothetical protein